MKKKSFFAFALTIALLGLTKPVLAETRTFELDAPAAKQVYLAGEMTNWDREKRRMGRDSDGRWRTTVDLGPGEWIYKFVVDGKWIADPVGPDHADDGQGGTHSFVFIGDGPWMEQEEVAHGSIHTEMLASAAWGKPMKVHVYLPPEFHHGQSIPVLVLLHGAGNDADHWYETGKIHRYMDNLLAQGRIDPFIIVMPSSENVFYVNQSEHFITQEIPLWLKKEWGIETNKATCAVAGMSMGGFGAFHLPLAHPSQFGFGFALSGYYPPAFTNKLTKQGALPFKFMMLTGSEDIAVIDTNRDLALRLKERHATFYYRENPGAHTFQYWSNHIVEMLTSVDSFFKGKSLPHNEDTLEFRAADVTGK